jgi:hypothetical protein
MSYGILQCKGSAQGIFKQIEYFVIIMKISAIIYRHIPRDSAVYRSRKGICRWARKGQDSEFIASMFLLRWSSPVQSTNTQMHEPRYAYIDQKGRLRWWRVTKKSSLRHYSSVMIEFSHDRGYESTAVHVAFPIDRSLRHTSLNPAGMTWWQAMRW